MAQVASRIQTTLINEGEEYTRFCQAGENNEGAIAVFTGKVRGGEGYPQKTILHLSVEHYPLMSEKLLERAALAIAKKYDLMRFTVIHRVGRVIAGETLVLVLVSSPHRAQAFAAAQKMMDCLKTEIPFWKKETSTQDSVWVKPPERD